MAKPEPLAVWLHGIRVGTLTSTGRPYDLTLRYSAEALDRWPGNTPVLSCSLPLGRRRTDAREYFRGLLPEGQHLANLAARAKLSVTDLHGLLLRYGRDVAGAVTILPEGADPADRVEGAVLYEPERLVEDIANLDSNPLAIYDDSELSLPGLQDKLLLIRDGDRWLRPTGGRPSTHIVKAEDRRFPSMVTLEAGAMTLARRVGLTTVDVEVVRFGSIDCIVVERFDRTVDADGALARIHQEDVCQALGHDSEANQRRAKYEHGGGPGLAAMAGLLDRYAADPVAELTRLVRAVTFNTVIGNADAHAKNLSLLHRVPGVVELAPLYDTVPTCLFRTLQDRAAMFVNGQTVLSRVRLADVIAEATRWPLAGSAAETAATQTVASMLEHLDGLPDQLAAAVSARATAFL